MEDGQIVELYWRKDPEAISESGRKYGPRCRAIAWNILGSWEDAEECVNDTWLSAWNAMPPQRPGRLGMFLARITRNLALNRFAAGTARKRGGGEILLVLDELAECLPGGADVEAACEARDLEECVCRFVRGLPEREGNVFIRRCFFTEPVAEIARRYGLTGNHVMVMLSRTRRKLREHLIREGYIHG